MLEAVSHQISFNDVHLNLFNISIEGVASTGMLIHLDVWSGRITEHDVSELNVALQMVRDFPFI